MQGIQTISLAFHTICSPLPRTINIYQYPSLQDVDLAHCLTTTNTGSNHDSNVDVLISSGYYWDLVLGEIKWHDNGLLVN